MLKISKHLAYVILILLSTMSQISAGEIKFFAFSTLNNNVNLAESQLASAYKQYQNDKNDKNNEEYAVAYSRSLHENIAINKELKVKDALNKLDSILKGFPDNQVLKAYHASAICMSARDVWFIPMRIMKVNKCTKILDDIVKNNPSNAVVRAIRAGNSISLPERFDRRSLAIEDIHVLLSVPEGFINIENIQQRLVTQLVVLYGDAKDHAKQQQSFEQLQSLNPKNELLQIAKSSLI